MRKAITYSLIIAGGAAVWLFPKLNALYLFCLLTALVIFFIKRDRKEKEKGFLVTMVILIFLSRFLISLFILSARGGDLFQDEGLYSKKALMKAYYIKGIEKDLGPLFYRYYDDYDMVNEGYGRGIYTNMLAWFYYLFGYQTQAVRLINTFLNILVFLIVFYMTRDIFDSRAARISSSVFAFFPSIALWSVMIGIDFIALLCISVYLYSLIKILDKFRFRHLFLMASSAAIMNMIRDYITGILITVAALAFIYRLWQMVSRRGRLAIVLFLAAISIYAQSRLPVLSLAEEKLQEKVGMLAQRQRNYARIDEGGYITYPAYCYQGLRCTIPDLFKAYMKGMAYALFSPFPWQIDSKIQLMAYPQIILFYFSLPFIIYGFYRGLKVSRTATLVISLYVVILFSVFALVEGNVGAVFRHRDMATPFLLIYFGGGTRKK